MSSGKQEVVMTLAMAPPVAAVAPRPANRSKAHWRVLRQALLRAASSSSSSTSSSSSSDATASSISTAFFPQFGSRRAADDALVCYNAAHDDFEWKTFDLSVPDHFQATQRLWVHDKKPECAGKVKLTELFSHKVHHGVDNTGNIRTWPAEQVLLAYMLKNSVVASVVRNTNSNDENEGDEEEGGIVRCCELGAGMAGLAGLGLALHHQQAAAEPSISMLITDGNPLSVRNVALSLQENVAQGVLRPHASSSSSSSSLHIQVELLRWDRAYKPPADRAQQFDLLFASDCLFFEAFHVDLAHTIQCLLRPATGKCLLLQPQRGGSLDRFCAVASAPPFGLTVERIDDFDPAITRLHHTSIWRGRRLPVASRTSGTNPTCTCQCCWSCRLRIVRNHPKKSDIWHHRLVWERRARSI